MDAWIDGYLDFSFELVILFRIVLSLVLSGVIGLEREYYGRPAGFRTHILVSLGATLVMCISLYGFAGQADSARLAAQVISGIGFIGAGAIIHSEKDIKGLTTAATLWITAMIGLAAGNGFYFGAIVTTLLAIIVLIWFRTVERKISKTRVRLQASVEWNDAIVLNLMELIKEFDLTTYAVETKRIIINDKSIGKFNIIFKKDYQSDKLD